MPPLEGVADQPLNHYPSPMSLKKLGQYDLIRVLGKGTMGLVHERRDPNLTAG